MSFRRGARLDPGQVRDVRGSRSAIALGGGGIATVVLAVVVMLLGGDPTALLTGEGVTTPLTFTRQRQLTLQGPLRIY